MGNHRRHSHPLGKTGGPIAVVTWEVPVLAKYRLNPHSFGHTSFRPFVEAGASYRTTGNLNGTDPSHLGFSAGAGVEIPVHGFALAPTIRYTRWQHDGAIGVVDSRPDQLEFLVGFTHANALGKRGSFPLSIGGFAGTDLLGDYRTTVYSVFFPTGNSLPNVDRPGPHSILYGGEVELQLPGNLAIEGDVESRNLHDRFQYFPNGVGPAQSSVNSFNTWQFPVLLKWCPSTKLPFLSHAWTPIVEAGPSFRLPISLPRFGFTAGLGVKRPWGKFTLEPSLRYTRWQSSPYETTKEDELDILLSLRF